MAFKEVLDGDGLELDGHDLLDPFEEGLVEELSPQVERSADQRLGNFLPDVGDKWNKQ